MKVDRLPGRGPLFGAYALRASSKGKDQQGFCDELARSGGITLANVMLSKCIHGSNSGESSHLGRTMCCRVTTLSLPIRGVLRTPRSGSADFVTVGARS